MVTGLYRTFTAFRETWTASSSITRDLRDTGVAGPVRKIGIRMAGDIVAGGGGALSGQHLDCPIQMISNIRLQGHHVELGTIDIYNGQTVDLYWLFSRINNYRGLLNGALPGVGATSQWSAYFEIPLHLPKLPRLTSYLDPRVFSSLNLTLDFPAASTYAATNFSAINNALVDIYVTEMVAGAPPADAPHFVPRINTLRQPTESANTQLRSAGIGGGFVPLLHYRQYDDSATSDSERVDGLVRRMKVIHRGVNVFDGHWTALREFSRNGGYGMGGEMAGVSAPGATNQDPAGVVIYDPDNDSLGSAALDARFDPIFHDIDTSTASQQDITAITPATSDLLIINAFTLVPNAAAAKKLSEFGL